MLFFHKTQTLEILFYLNNSYLIQVGIALYLISTDDVTSTTDDYLQTEITKGASVCSYLLYMTNQL